MNCKEAVKRMHDYFDGDLMDMDLVDLQKHMQACPACADRFRKLEQTVAFLRIGIEQMCAPEHVTTRIMLSLPPVQRKNAWSAWIRKHPAISVASVFLAVVAASYISLWNANTELVIRGDDLNALVIDGNTVHVPSGTKVNGDLYIENGTVQVDGEVSGNIVVVDGKIALASTAYISGEIQEVDELAEWLVFKMNQWMNSIVK
jgi:anti-sigma factor RsiW